MISKETAGKELEQAYAKVLKGRVVGGFGDGGKDVEIPGPVRFIQVKSSWDIARNFLATSVKFRKFVPLCIGDPSNNPEEITRSLVQFGGFVGPNIPKRETLLHHISQVRAMCM